MVIGRKRSESQATRRRCGSCQQRHIKCEYPDKDEKCKACRTANRACIVRHRFQHVDPTAPKRSKVTANVEDQDTNTGFQIIQEYGRDVSRSGDSAGSLNEQIVTEEDVRGDTPQAVTSPRPQTAVISDSESVLQTSLVPSSRSQGSGQWIDSTSFTVSTLDSPAQYSISALNFQSPTSLPTPESVGATDREKALLLRHFTDVLSRWFDVCDPDQHFRRVVPLRALTCPTLMKAISASSAWHLNRQGRFDRERSNFLYQNCLNHLIRVMDSPSVGSDDSVLVAAVIMHHVEELRDLEHTLNLESRGHIIGMRVFLDAQDPTTEYSSLRTAAFRTAVREEIHVCFVDQNPLTLPAEVCNTDRSFNEADDDTWAWRMILLFRDALAYSLSPSAVSEWDLLDASQRSWADLRPSSFDPTFSQPANPEEGRYLPEIWYLLDCHIIGAIHYHLCRLVLAISNPRTPKIGWNKAAAAKQVEDEIKNSVVEICGIALANQSFPSAMTAGTMVTTMCADSIDDPCLQDTLFDVLVQTRTIHAWPTEAAQRYVRSVWQAKQEQSPNSPLSIRSLTSHIT